MRATSSLLQEIGAIERVALGGNVAGVVDDAAQLGFVGAVAHARGINDVFLDQDTAHVVGAELQAHLAYLDARREPARLDVVNVVEIEPADGEWLQVIDSGGLWNFRSEERRVGQGPSSARSTD